MCYQIKEMDNSPNKQRIPGLNKGIVIHDYLAQDLRTVFVKQMKNGAMQNMFDQDR
jgi:hypothetical protein